MAAIDHSAYAPASPFAGFAGSFQSAMRGIRTYICYRQTLNTLSALSPRQLEDIGLDASNIDAVARKMAERSTY